MHNDHDTRGHGPSDGCAIERPSMLVTVGPAASGKSSIAASLFITGVIDDHVTTDAIRAELGLAADERDRTYAEARRRLDEGLRAGRTVLYDSTCLLPSHRLPLLSVAAARGVPAVALRIGADLTLDELIARDASRARHVPVDALREHHEQMRAFASREQLEAEGFRVIDVAPDRATRLEVVRSA